MDLEKEIARIKVRVDQNHAMLKSLRRHARVSSTLSFFKLLIILIPVLLAIFYAPRIISQYQDLMQMLQSNILSPTLPQGIDLGTLQEAVSNVTTGVLER